MRFEGIKKVLDGHFINRYDITYTTEDNRTKVYEIISRNDNVSSLADATSLRTGMLSILLFVGYITFIGFWARPLINNKTISLKELLKK